MMTDRIQGSLEVEEGEINMDISRERERIYMSIDGRIIEMLYFLNTCKNLLDVINMKKHREIFGIRV